MAFVALTLGIAVAALGAAGLVVLTATTSLVCSSESLTSDAELAE